MQLDLFMLARHAEAQGDLLNILGGGWDSITITEKPEGLPDDTVALLGGSLVTRVLFHQITETDRDHRFSITLVDEDGAQVARLDGTFPVARAENIPVGWPQNVNIVLPLSIPLPRFGAFTFALEVDGHHLGERAFRVIDGRGDADAAAA
jgi:hypothetical protein